MVNHIRDRQGYAEVLYRTVFKYFVISVMLLWPLGVNMYSWDIETAGT